MVQVIVSEYETVMALLIMVIMLQEIVQATVRGQNVATSQVISHTLFSAAPRPCSIPEGNNNPAIIQHA